MDHDQYILHFVIKTEYYSANCISFFLVKPLPIIGICMQPTFCILPISEVCVWDNHEE